MEKRVRNIIALLVAGIIGLACLYYLVVYYGHDSIPVSSGLNREQNAMANISLNDKTVKSYLDNRTYNLSAIDLQNQYVLVDVGTENKPWNRLIVGVDLANNTTTCVYNIEVNYYHSPGALEDLARTSRLINIALENKTVYEYVGHQVCNVSAVGVVHNLHGPDIYVLNFDVLNDSGSVSWNVGVGIDQKNMTVTSVEKREAMHF